LNHNKFIRNDLSVASQQVGAVKKAVKSEGIASVQVRLDSKSKIPIRLVEEPHQNGLKLGQKYEILHE